MRLLNIKCSNMTKFIMICAKDGLNVIPQGYFSFATMILILTTYQSSRPQVTSLMEKKGGGGLQK
jgi:hypothetical protein